MIRLSQHGTNVLSRYSISHSETNRGTHFLPTICPTCGDRLYNNGEIAFCENAHVFEIVKPKRKKEGKGTDAKRITRLLKRANRPNYVVYQNGTLATAETFTRQRDAVLFALHLHDANAADSIQVSGYGATGKYFFQQYGQPKE